jgi:polysaccharide export outer membrane protein
MIDKRIRLEKQNPETMADSESMSRTGGQMIGKNVLGVITAAAFVAVVSALHGQAFQTPSPTGRLSINTSLSKDSVSSGSEPKLEQRYPRYIIQRQDVLLLSFPLTPELNQTVTVQPDGFINLQNGRSLRVQGLTVPQLGDDVKQAYVGTLHDPIVEVDLKDFQRPLFTVSGQVGKPGQYELREDITVSEAIAVAGGMVPAAKTQIFLFHRVSDQFEVEKVNLKEILNGKKPNEDPIVEPGDMIYVPEKFIANFKKYVPYSINAGTYLTPF